MIYLKGINESSGSEIFKKLGITEQEYLDMISFIYGLSYPEVIRHIPFVMKLKSSSISEVGYERAKIVVDFYRNKKIELGKIEEVEDYFLDFMDDNMSPVKVSFDYIRSEVLFTFKVTDLISFSEYMIDIDKKFKRSNTKYSIIDLNKLDGKILLNIRINV